MPIERNPYKEEYLPLIRMKKQDKSLGRTTSVITDPQESIWDAIKEDDGDLLTAILTNEDYRSSIDLNHVYPDGMTLLHHAIVCNNAEAVRLLVANSDVDCDKPNRAKSTPLHVAARKGSLGILQILLGSGRVDVNAVAPGGETALHILARKATNLAYVECLKLVLRSDNVNVDAPEETASMTPLFIATEESRSKEAAVVLIRANADVNVVVDDVDLRQALIKQFGKSILDNIPDDLDEAMRGMDVGNRGKLLHLLNESVIRDTLNDFQQEVSLRGSCEDINKSAPGALNLVQIACEMGLDKHLKVMLSVEGIDVNAASNGTEPGLILAAKMAHGEVLKVLLDFGSTNIGVSSDMGTILHTILRKPIPNQNYDEALQLMLTSEHCKSKLRSIINLRDCLDNTALHYATQFWPQSIVREMLELGANIGLKNIYDEVPINKILPEVMEDFLNDVCLVPDGDVTNSDFKIKALFDFLVPFGTNFSPSANKVTDKKNNTLEVPLPETEGLWYMSQSKKHCHLLKHPVIATFLWMKWKRIGFVYNRNLFIYLAFVTFITSYIFVLYPGRSIRSDSIVEEVCDAASEVRGDVQVLWGLSTFCLICLIIREFLQIGIAFRRYIFSLENWVELTLIAMTSVLLFHGDYSCHLEAKRHLAAFIIVLSWSELITMVGKHPKLSQINIYVTMLYKVLGTFILFLTWYSWFIFAFGFGFYILLHQDNGQAPAEGHEYLFFDTLYLCIIKTFTMFVGELEFGDLPIETPVGYIFLLCFIFLIVVVLMNLLNGLAVSDTGVIRSEAEIHSFKTQIEIISYIESTLLGDPFNFLANWPSFVWLRRLPTCSLVGGGRLYKVPQLREFFHKLTRARNIMLFQGTSKLHPQGYSVTFMPNQDHSHLQFLCSCCTTDDDQSSINDLPSSVTESAKDVILEVGKSKAEMSEKNQIESRLERIESMLHKLLQAQH